MRVRAARSSSIALLLLVGLSACASPVSGEDQRALSQLADIAARDAFGGVEVSDESGSTVDAVDCWLPSDHPLDEGGFRVLCRVHYDEAGAARYRDMICIGDVVADPVSDYCYQWAPYSDMPSFEDHPAHPAR